MVVYNFTDIQRREKRLYTFFNVTVSKNGIVTRTVVLMFAMVVLFAIPGGLVCYFSGKFWYNPLLLMESPFAGYFYLFFIFLPMSAGVALNTLKIQNYRIIDYLKIYFMPKPPVDKDGKKFKIQAYKLDALIERL